ncbi:MAG: DNA polymerase III subunit beta [Myxococcota bacterium]
MELIAPKKTLLRLLQRCQGVADKKAAMPVLANVLLVAEGDQLKVAATDLYVSVRGSLDAEVKRAGSVAIPARDVFDRVRHMPDGPVQITVGNGSATTLTGVGSKRRYTLHGLPGSEFPKLPEMTDDTSKMDLPVLVLSKLIARTHFAISTDETRAHLNSALFECEDSVVRMVTTDGHRLTKMEEKVEGLDAKTTMLIPLKAVQELRKLLDEATDKGTAAITVAQSGPNAFFELDGISFTVKLVDAQFPPYDAVIPAVTDRAVQAPRTLLSDALKAVALAASDRTGGVKLAVADDALRITSESPESGNGFDEVAIDYQGPEITVGFNAKYLLDVLNVIDFDDISLGLSGELDPALIRPVSPDEETADDYIAVVMPMRI